MTKGIHGLYVITDPSLQPPDRLAQAVAAALQGGARVVQYRDKGGDAGRRRQEARAIAAECRAASALFLVNDDMDLAAEVGADGVHLGRDDGAVAAARARLGPDAVIGVSCYNETQRALEAEADGATYVALGSAFPSATKPHAVRADLAVFREARRRVALPVVAIGGIDADNAASVIAAGADAVAVISAVFGAADVAAAARQIASRVMAARRVAVPHSSGTG